MATEFDIGVGVLQIAASRPNGVATFKRCWAEIPANVALSAANTAPSATRPGEPMWKQIVRNIKSHDAAQGNFIQQGFLSHVPRVGYQITAAGRVHLAGLA